MTDAYQPGSCLAALFAPIPVQTFFDDYFPARPLVVHGARERLVPFHELPALRDLDELLRQKHADVRVFYDDSNGVPSQAPVEPSLAAKLYRDLGLTVCTTSTQLPELDGWLRQLERELGLLAGAATCNVYASPPGDGFVMHFDHTLKIIVQLHGQKRWRIGANTNVINPVASFTPRAAPPRRRTPGQIDAQLPTRMPDDSEEHTLEPGAVLFLPRGYWHETVGLEASLSVSITLTVPSWSDLLTRAIHTRLSAHPEWREAAFGLWGGGVLRARARDRIEALATSAADDLGPMDLDSLLALVGAASPLESLSSRGWLVPVTDDEPSGRR